MSTKTMAELREWAKVHGGKPMEENMLSTCNETVLPYWDTAKQCTSETCNRPTPCEVHGHQEDSPKEKPQAEPLVLTLRCDNTDSTAASLFLLELATALFRMAVKAVAKQKEQVRP